MCSELRNGNRFESTDCPVACYRYCLARDYFVGLFAFGILARGWLANNETKKVDNFLLLTIILSLVWSVITVASIGAFTNKKYTVAKVAR